MSGYYQYASTVHMYINVHLCTFLSVQYKHVYTAHMFVPSRKKDRLQCNSRLNMPYSKPVFKGTVQRASTMVDYGIS